MASISEEFSDFDFDRLSASCLRGLVLKQEQKEVVSHLLEGKMFWRFFQLSLERV